MILGSVYVHFMDGFVPDTTLFKRRNQSESIELIVGMAGSLRIGRLSAFCAK